jgi:protein O-GlcNAc transferase
MRRLLRRLLSRALGGRDRADSYISLGRQCEDSGLLQEAVDHYRNAALADPHYAAPYVNLGIALEAAGDADGAMNAWQRAIALQPDHAAANFNLGRSWLRAGDAARAESFLRAALAARPDFPEAHVTLAAVQEARGDMDGALRSLQSALAVRPDYVGALKNFGALLGLTERWAEAAEAFRRAVSLVPEDADVHYQLGNAYVRLGKPAPALQSYRDAVRRRHTFAEAWCAQGNLLSDGGAQQDALDCFEKALALRPDYADAHLGMGNVFGVVGRLGDAETHFRRALSIDPTIVLAQLNLGIVLSDQGKMDEALDCLRRSLELRPEWHEARWAYAMAHVPTLRTSGSDLASIRRRIADEFDALDRWFVDARVQAGHQAVGIRQPFWLAYQEEDNRALLERYGALCARLMGHWQRRHGYLPDARRGRRPIRVGIVSQHLRSHSVWQAFVRGWFQKLDTERIHLIAFSLNPQSDDQTSLAKSRAVRFEQGHLGLDRWCEVILDSAPDALIYPEVGMDPITLKLASMQLAPLQAASWGHPETTGLPTIDWYLSAAGMEPKDAQSHYSEKLLPLPGLGCYVERQIVGAPAQKHAEDWGLRRDVPKLVSPGTPFKYAPEHDWVLAEIARRLGGCQIVLFEYRAHALTTRLRDRLRSAFSERGVDFDHCVRFLPWQADDAFRALLCGMDVYLDTIGFSGFNTAMQAVEANLPIVTCEGRFLRGRLASGILRRMGLDELVADDHDGYIERAVRLAREPDYRHGIRQRMAAACSVLYEDLEPIRALERFLDQGL